MTLARARIVKASTDAVSLRGSVPTGRGRRVTPEEADAATLAERILESARTEAEALRAGAESVVREARERGEAEGRADAAIQLATHCVAIREREARFDELAADRIVTYATLLAERILGRAVREDRTTITGLAAQLLSEAPLAGKVVLHVHPEDANGLDASLAPYDPERRVAEVVPNPGLRRGDLLLETPSGTIDARLGPSLERLSVPLREALRR